MVELDGAASSSLSLRNGDGDNESRIVLVVASLLFRLLDWERALYSSVVVVVIIIMAICGIHFY